MNEQVVPPAQLPSSLAWPKVPSSSWVRVGERHRERDALFPSVLAKWVLLTVTSITKGNISAQMCWKLPLYPRLHGHKITEWSLGGGFASWSVRGVRQHRCPSWEKLPSLCCPASAEPAQVCLQDNVLRFSFTDFGGLCQRWSYPLAATTDHPEYTCTPCPAQEVTWRLSNLFLPFSWPWSVADVQTIESLVSFAEAPSLSPCVGDHGRFQLPHDLWLLSAAFGSFLV